MVYASESFMGKSNELINRNNLKVMREAYGVTQSELARILDVSRVSVCNWENSDNGQISRTNLEKLSKLYGVSVNCFYGDYVEDGTIDTIMKQKEDAMHNGINLKNIRSTKLKDNKNKKDRTRNYRRGRPSSVPSPSLPDADAPNSNLSFFSKSEERSQLLLASFKEYTFKDALENYMYAMRLLIVFSDGCSKDELELATKIKEHVNRELDDTFANRMASIENGGGIQDEIQKAFKDVTQTDKAEL